MSTPDKALEFETFIRIHLPKYLKLSGSKRSAMASLFYGFADWARLNMNKNEVNAIEFMDSFIMRIKKAEKWRSAKGTVTVTKKELEKLRQVMGDNEEVHACSFELKQV